MGRIPSVPKSLREYLDKKKGNKEKGVNVTHFREIGSEFKDIGAIVVRIDGVNYTDNVLIEGGRRVLNRLLRASERNHITADFELKTNKDASGFPTVSFDFKGE